MTARTSTLTLALRGALSRMLNPRRSTPVVHENGHRPGAGDEPGASGPSAKWLALG